MELYTGNEAASFCLEFQDVLNSPKLAASFTISPYNPVILSVSEGSPSVPLLNFDCF
jgi:hypothetical protein